MALAVLDLLDELESVFHEPLHLCDIKPEHFGISNQGRVKFLDMDTIFFKTIIDILASGHMQLNLKSSRVLKNMHVSKM